MSDEASRKLITRVASQLRICFRGSYSGESYQDLACSTEFQSMGRTGSALDNAVAESCNSAWS
jgi:hypothetical protein